MAAYVNKGADIYVNGFYIQGFAKSFEFKTDEEPQDKTTLGDTTRTYLPGLNVVEVNIEGYEDYAATTGMDANFNVIDGGLTKNYIVTSCPQDHTAGNPCMTGTFNTVDYVKTHAVGEMVKFTIKAQASGSIWFRGTVLEGDRSISGAGNGTAIQLGAVTAAQGVYGALHVTQAGTGLVAKIQSDSSAGFASPTDVITFATTSAVGAELKSTMGANTDTYWRVNWALTSGTCIFSVVMGIR
jgi:hypothetical protein